MCIQFMYTHKTYHLIELAWRISVEVQYLACHAQMNSADHIKLYNKGIVYSLIFWFNMSPSLTLAIFFQSAYFNSAFEIESARLKRMKVIVFGSSLSSVLFFCHVLFTDLVKTPRNRTMQQKTNKCEQAIFSLALYTFILFLLHSIIHLLYNNTIVVQY